MESGLVEFGRLLDRQVAGLFAVEDAIAALLQR